MTTALVIGASGGIGSAVAAALEGDGVAVTRLSRAQDGFDVTAPDAALKALDGVGGPFDLVFVALGILAPDGGAPEKALAQIEAAAMAQVLAVNTIGPALVLSRIAQLLPRDRRGVVAVLSARVGSIGDNRIGGWHSYRASKAALNQLIRGAAIELGRTHKQAVCVALHPGTVATPFTADYAGRHRTVSPEEAAGNLLAVIEGLTPGQSGGFYDYAGEVVPW
jgi:NAD(P)-dependent dehydrogenase (short-subunit alcohol dehydrogenase family)